MTIYALFHETDGDDGQIEALYLNEGDANAARLAALRAARDAGLAVYWDPDTGEERDDWDHNWRVDAEEVLTAPPDVACTAQGCGSVARRAHATDAIGALQCGGCLTVGKMAPAQTHQSDADTDPSVTYAPNPIAVIMAGMVDTLNGTAASLQRGEMRAHVRRLAGALALPVTIDDWLECGIDETAAALQTAAAFAREAIHEDRDFQREVRRRVDSAILARGETIGADEA